MNELWNQLASAGGIELSADQHDRLERFLAILAEANTRMNLTRIVDLEQARLHHVADSLTLLPYLPSGRLNIADLGSGGGVPGLVLAIVRPDCRFCLIESTLKKARFLREAAIGLELPNVEVLPLRAEDVGLGPQRESFDVVIARAVAEMVWLVEWCLPLMKHGGRLLAMKGEKIHAELPRCGALIRRLGGSEAKVFPVSLIGTDHRVIVQIDKTGKTASHYPRPATLAKGKPLA